jgi:hypothetical protein
MGADLIRRSVVILSLHLILLILISLSSMLLQAIDVAAIH